MVVSVAETPYIVDARICKWTGQRPGTVRERGRLIHERTTHINRMKDLIVQPG